MQLVPTWQLVYTSALRGTVCLVFAALIYSHHNRKLRRDHMSVWLIFHEAMRSQSAAGNNSDGVSPRKDLMRLLAFAMSVPIAAILGGSQLRQAILCREVLHNIDEGGQQAFLGNYIGAIIFYKQAVRDYPEYSRPHLLIGSALLKSGRITAGSTELRTAHALNPKDGETSLLLGDAYGSLKMHSQAASAYRDAIRASPTMQKAYLRLGVCLEALGNPDEAYQSYEKAITLDPFDAGGHRLVGSLLIRHDALAEGIAHCMKAIKLSPRVPDAYADLAAGLAKSGRYKEAAEQDYKCLEIDSQHVVAMYDLGQLMLHQGLYEQALHRFNSCLRLEPRTDAELDAKNRARRQAAKLTVKH